MFDPCRILIGEHAHQDQGPLNTLRQACHPVAESAEEPEQQQQHDGLTPGPYALYLMHHLLRHTWSVSVLSALLVVGLLHAHPALPGPLLSSSAQVPHTATPFPKQENAGGPRIAIPLSATVPAAESKQPLEGAPDGTTASRGPRSVAYDADFTGSRGFLAASSFGPMRPISRMHLFCVYRL